VKFNADEWVRIAKDAGMKYMVLTTKHHDGFCLWNTAETSHNIMNSPFERDVVEELSAACRKQGLAFGAYYSVCDWHHPDFPLTSPGGKVRRETSNLDRYEQYLRAQVKELIQNYGPLWVMWFDVPQEFDVKRGQGLIELCRSLQPGIIVNNRSGAPGDYDSPEQHVGAYQDQRPWETCMTLCQQWAWKPDDEMKSLEDCLHKLILCAGGDGNLLFNVGPMPDGRIEPRQVERLKEMGAWLKKYGETIYGTRGGPFKPTKSLASTRKGKTIFVHLLRWDGDTIALPNIPAKIQRSSLVTGGKVAVRQSEAGITIKVSPPDRRENDTIVRLELDQPAGDIVPVSLPSGIKTSASNVYQRMEEYGSDKAFDDNPYTRWATDGGTKRAWVATEFAKPTTFDGVRIQEAVAGRVQAFELQFKDGDAWNTIFSGTTIGGQFKKTFPPVTAREIRLNILDATEGPTIADIQVTETKRPLN